MVRRIIFSVAGVMAFCVLAGLLLYEGPVKSALARARDAQAQVDIARSELGSSLSSLNSAHLDVARAAISQARGDIASINSSEDAFGPLLDVAQIVPVAGSRIAHARNALSVIRDALTAADLGTTASQAILASEHAAPGGHAMDRMMSALVAQRPTFVQALTALRQAQRESRELPASTGLGAHTDHLLSVFRERATTADQALTTLVATTDLIQRGSSILLVSQDPAEQRATGGYIGFSGLLRVTTNGFHLSRFISSGKVDPQFQPHNGIRPPGLVRPPQQAEAYASWAAWLFRDSNWWPDFPTSAREMLAFYQRGQRVAADGVIAFEPQMVVRLLGFTGPVPVPGYKETLTASNGLERLRYYEFQRDDRTFVTAAWQAIIEQMLSLPSSQAPSFAQSMLDGLKAKELRMFFKDPTMQTQLRSGGVDGAVSQAPGDYLYVVDTNLGYSKLDPYVPRTARLTVRLARDGSALHTLILHYTNSWPEGKQLSRDMGGSQTTYVDYLRVLVPSGSTLVSAAGWDNWSPRQESGRTELSGGIYVRAGTDLTVTVVYRVPAVALAAVPYRLTVQAQPGGYAALVTPCIDRGALLTCGAPSASDFVWRPSLAVAAPR